MSTLRAKIKWTIPGAGNALSVLHFGMLTADPADNADAAELLTRVDSFCTDIRPLLPQEVQVQAQAEVEVIDQPTGDMIGVVDGGSKSVKTGSATAGTKWAAPTGSVITWNTTGVLRNRRVRGRTFVVPMASSAYDIDGTLTSTALTTLNSAATSLRAAGTLTELIVYNRPTTPGGTDGTGFVVSSHRVPDFAAILRSRRS